MNTQRINFEKPLAEFIIFFEMVSLRGRPTTRIQRDHRVVVLRIHTAGNNCPRKTSANHSVVWISLANFLVIVIVIAIAIAIAIVIVIV
jgi:hypothetical protein